MKDHQKRGSMVVSQRIGQRRHYVLLLITAAFITFATAWWLQFEGTGSQQLSHGDSFRGLAWAAWGFLVLAATFHRGWGRPTSEQRGALSDELTLAHRRSAIGAGYWITLLGAGLLLGITLIGGADLSVPLLILLLTIGVAAPALLFFVLQLQAARD